MLNMDEFMVSSVLVVVVVLLMLCHHAVAAATSNHSSQVVAEADALAKLRLVEVGRRRYLF